MPKTIMQLVLLYNIIITIQLSIVNLYDET